MTDFIRLRFLDTETIALVPADRVHLQLHNGKLRAHLPGESKGQEVSSALYVTTEMLVKHGIAAYMTDTSGVADKVEADFKPLLRFGQA